MAITALNSQTLKTGSVAVQATRLVAGARVTAASAPEEVYKFQELQLDARRPSRSLTVLAMHLEVQLSLRSLTAIAAPKASPAPTATSSPCALKPERTTGMEQLAHTTLLRKTQPIQMHHIPCQLALLLQTNLNAVKPQLMLPTPLHHSLGLAQQR